VLYVLARGFHVRPICYSLLFQELDAVEKELATLRDVIRETAAQVEPFKQAKEAAKKAHKVISRYWYGTEQCSAAMKGV